MTDAQQQESHPIEVNYKNNPEYHRFAEFVGVDRHKRRDFETAKKLSFIYDWAKKESGSENPTEITECVSKGIKELGMPARGKTLVDNLYQRVRLKCDREREEINRRMRIVGPQVKKKIKKIVKQAVKEAIENG